MQHAKRYTDHTQPRLGGSDKGRIPWVSQPVIDAIKAAGEKGANSLELAEITGHTRRSVNESCANARARTGLVYSLGEAKKHYVRHFWHEVPVQKAEQTMERVKAEIQAAREARDAESKRLSKDIYSAKKRKNEARLAELMALQVRRAEEREAARKAHKEEMAKAADARRKDSALKRKIRANNAVADRYRGTASPKERAREITIVWPEHVKVQVCKGWTPRFADIQPAGVIPKTIGHFTEKEVSPWVKAIAA
jgi:hypothetical protein